MAFAIAVCPLANLQCVRSVKRLALQTSPINRRTIENRLVNAKNTPDRRLLVEGDHVPHCSGDCCGVSCRWLSKRCASASESSSSACLYCFENLLDGIFQRLLIRLYGSIGSSKVEVDLLSGWYCRKRRNEMLAVGCKRCVANANVSWKVYKWVRHLAGFRRH